MYSGDHSGVDTASSVIDVLLGYGHQRATLLRLEASCPHVIGPGSLSSTCQDLMNAEGIQENGHGNESCVVLYTIICQ